MNEKYLVKLQQDMLLKIFRLRFYEFAIRADDFLGLFPIFFLLEEDRSGDSFCVCLSINGSCILKNL